MYIAYGGSFVHLLFFKAFNVKMEIFQTGGRNFQCKKKTFFEKKDVDLKVGEVSKK